MNDDITIIQHDDVGFVPERFFPQLSDDMTPATAACLVREFGECPECGSSIDPDVTDAVAEDRDVLWYIDDTDLLHKSDYHTCESCGATLQIFVEENARPAQWSTIPDEHWADRYLWIEMENGNYFVTNPGDIRIWSVD